MRRVQRGARLRHTVEYGEEAQRSWRGCSGARMPRYLRDGALEVPPEEIERRGAGDRAVGEQRLQDLPDLPLGDVSQIREEVPDPRGADLVERPRRGKRLVGPDGGSPLVGLDDETPPSLAFPPPPGPPP